MSTEPVTNWADDYDLFDPEFVNDPFSVWKGLRKQCPVAHSERWGGSYMPTTYANVTAVARNAEDFTSFEVNVTPLVTAYDEAGNRRRSIISADAPEHMPERRLILPFFAPRAVERYRESTRDLCRQLIRGFIEDGFVDAAGDYARQIPPRVIAEMLGIDPEMSDDFTFWVQCNLELGQKDPELSEKYRQIIQNFFAGRGRETTRQPRGRPDLGTTWFRARRRTPPVASRVGQRGPDAGCRDRYDLELDRSGAVASWRLP